MARNKNGMGSMYRRQNGRYEYRLTYINEEGERKRKSFYGDTEEECLDQADDFRFVQNMRNKGIDCDKTIPDLLKEKFREDYECNYVSEAGYDRNLATLKRIEDNPIGAIPIIYITEKQLELFMRYMTRYSNSVIAKTHQQLKLAFDLAIEEDIVGKNLMNSRKLKKRPKSSKPDKVVKGLTEEEQKRFVEALEADRVPRHRNEYKAQLKIELYTGMRMGEINALKKEDVDFDHGIIRISKTISRGLDARHYLKETTKTETGKREIPIKTTLFDRSWRKQ